MNTLIDLGVYTIVRCAECGLGIGLPPGFEQARRLDRKSFFCAWGHSQWFPGKTQEQQIKELRAQVATKDDLLQSARAEGEKRYRLQRAAEGKTRALKKRIAAGVCPCCSRTFQNLARHMKTQHPGVAAE